MPKSTPAITRIMQRVVETPGPLSTPCWLTNYVDNGLGYVVVIEGQIRKVIHRWTYEHFVGPVPDGLDLDHLCRNRGCCNPSHLEPVTRQVNMLRGVSPAALANRRGTCKRGHSLADACKYKKGRTCRTCQIQRSRDAYA